MIKVKQNKYDMMSFDKYKLSQTKYLNIECMSQRCANLKQKSLMSRIWHFAMLRGAVSNLNDISQKMLSEVK